MRRDLEWAELKESLRSTLGPLAESSLLLRGGWNTSSLEFALTDDPASDRNARQIFTELLKRVRLSQAEGEGTTPTTPVCSTQEPQRGWVAGGESLPLPAGWCWRPTEVEGLIGEGRCASATAGEDDVACTSFTASALQYVALAYQLGVAVVVAGAVAVHATQHLTRWLGQ